MKTSARRERGTGDTGERDSRGPRRDNSQSSQFAVARRAALRLSPAVPKPGIALIPVVRRPTVRWLTTAITTAMLAGTAGADDPRPRFKNRTPVLRPFFARDEDGSGAPQRVAPKPPGQFNPDPGGGGGPTPGVAPVVVDPLTPPDLVQPLFGADPIPDNLALPRRGVRARQPILKVWEHPEYHLGREGLGLLPHSKPVPNRWFLNFPRWKRYHDPTHETPYQYDTPALWHPYRQSTLKGDVPIVGQNIFTILTAKNFSLFEYRKLPVPSGVSAATANSSEFFGRSQQVFFLNDTSVAIDIFEGETAFKPVHWLVRVLGVYNNNWIRVKENNLLDPDPRGTEFDDNEGPPSTARIEAIPADSRSVNPQDGAPANFTKIINPGDLFNFIAPQLQPLGDAKKLVPVDPLTNEIPESEEDELNENEKKKGRRKKERQDFAGTRYTTRHRDFFALQEAFAELHISDLTDNYDFISSRWGIQPFVSDFRGFIFADTNLGARIFGNYDNNRLQYNLAYFNQREKDTYSDLNMFDSRHQQVIIANVFKQDFVWKGYTSQFSFHANIDDGGTHYDKNGFVTRPQILGTLRDDGDFFGNQGQIRGHDVKSFYFGWTGDGHIGRLNVTHAFYQVLGEDEHNGLAGRKVDINAQMAALELSYDRDWIRLKLSGFYASGDNEPLDRTARGFDTILDNPFFVGGPFSWYVHQGFNLAGTAVNLKQRDSLVPNLRTSKTEGQSNFVNPGVTIIGIGTDIEVTPKLRAFANLNYVWFAETKPLELALQTNKIRSELGLDASLGFKFRPLLTDNIIISAGVGFFFPGAGYRDIYRRNTELVAGFGPQDQAGKVDRYLYNGFLTLTMVY